MDPAPEHCFLKSIIYEPSKLVYFKKETLDQEPEKMPLLNITYSPYL
jgi:hypothetical protein